MSEAAWDRLGVAEGSAVRASHPNPIESLSSVRRRIYGHRLDRAALYAIISDVVKGQYADVHLSSFITSCAAVPLDEEETIALTRVMVALAGVWLCVSGVGLAAILAIREWAGVALASR